MELCVKTQCIQTFHFCLLCAQDFFCVFCKARKTVNFHRILAAFIHTFTPSGVFLRYPRTLGQQGPPFQKIDFVWQKKDQANCSWWRLWGLECRWASQRPACWAGKQAKGSEVALFCAPLCLSDIWAAARCAETRWLTTELINAAPTWPGREITATGAQ